MYSGIGAVQILLDKRERAVGLGLLSTRLIKKVAGCDVGRLAPRNGARTRVVHFLPVNALFCLLFPLPPAAG